MDSLKPQLPKISNKDRTPLVDVLLELLAWQQVQIDKLEQEILKLKGETTKNLFTIFPLPIFPNSIWLKKLEVAQVAYLFIC